MFVIIFDSFQSFCFLSLLSPMCLLSVDALKRYLLMQPRPASIAQCAQYPFKHPTFDDDTQIVLFWFDLMYDGSDIDYLTSLRSVFSDLTGF